MTTEIIRARGSDDIDRLLGIDAAVFHMRLDEADRYWGAVRLARDRAKL